MTPLAFQELHNGCRDKVLAGILGYVGNRSEAEEVTASAFATAFRKRNSFRRDALFFTWVYRIALNEAHSALRRRPMVSLDAMEGPTPEALVQPDLMDSALDRANCCRKLRMALKCLPSKYRQALVDHFVRGYSVKQAAKLRRIPVGTVLSRLFNGKKLLRRAWAVELGQEKGQWHGHK